MIPFWVAAAGLTVVVVALLVFPLMRAPRSSASRREYDLTVYRDQVAELERDRERGVIDAAQAETAKAELARRMLAADKDASEEPSSLGGGPGRIVLAVVLAAIIPAVAVVIYAETGRPDLPAQPLAARNLDQGETPHEVSAAIAELARRLEQNPEDLRGWLLLARSYGRLGQATESLNAWRRALALAPQDPNIMDGFAEAVVMVNNGIVTDEARTMFEAVEELQPDNPVARFYLALAQYQAGNLRTALDRWTALAEDTPADAPWLPIVRERITAVAGELGLDVAGAIPEPAAPMGPPPALMGRPEGQGTGPTREQMEAAQQMTPQDQEAMIRGMVEGLAARLEEDPSDVDSWMRLARAYQVLGQPADRVRALEQANQQAPDRIDILLAYGLALLETSPRMGPDDPVPPKVAEVMLRILALDPDQPDALWFAGIDAVNKGRNQEAIALWSRLLAQLDPQMEVYSMVNERLTALKEVAEP